ncbi:hypothetical protein ACFSSA_11900 [Luteolibacter algae]|uniref:Two-component sensor histidine kinase n=1 Tax=Luteolibacter algae TaxID=454151 RepID=A0ABW5D8I7_9BACT
MITFLRKALIPRDWWTRRSLKLRLAACFTVVSGAVSLVLIPAAYTLIDQRLHLEQDRQLRIDWALVEAHLEATKDGGIQWRSNSPATPSSAGYASTWFDVWSGKKMLLSHWPEDATQVLQPPRRGGKKAEIFYNIKLEENTPARSLQTVTRVDGRRVILRVFRDESGIRSTLREILAGLVLGLPISILLAGAGGYLMAGKALKPLRAMASEAGKITS